MVATIAAHAIALALMQTSDVASVTRTGSAVGARPAAAIAPPPARAVQQKTYGFVESLSGNTLVIRNRAGRAIAVDVRAARSSVVVYPGRPVIVFGPANPAGTIVATAVWRTFPDAAHWPADR